jgi:protein gp37
LAEKTGISWTHHTFNPWWGCTRVSPGCVHCYAETFDRRVHGKDKAHWGVKAGRRFFGDKHWNEPLKWNAAAARAGERHRVFCASMADVFEDRPELVEHRARLLALILATPRLDWLLLTKRPENMVRLALEAGWEGRWPTNVWAGTTTEDQQRADERIPHLLRVPAAVRFLSCEPLLGPVDVLSSIRKMHEENPFDPVFWTGGGVDWVIVGGESGHGARRFDLAWARALVRQCTSAGVAVFVKQFGARPAEFVALEPVGTAAGHDDFTFRTGSEYDPEPVWWDLKDPKGGDWTEWPEDLRVREFPEPIHG